MLNTKSVEDLQRTNHFSCLIYGEPGVGKTTFALTATKPLLLDCDNEGSSRVKLDVLANADCATISSFQELEAITEEDIAPYETIIIDTFGTLVEYAALSITQGAPSPKEWGLIRTKVLNFLHKIEHKNRITIAHVKAVEQGTSKDKITKLEPLAQGSAIDAFITQCTIMGFMSRNASGQTIINFSGGETTQGKNTFDFPPMVIAPNDYKAFQRLEQKIKAYREQELQQQEKFKNIWLPLRAKIDQATTPEHFTMIRNEFLQEEDILHLHDKARRLLNERNNLPQFRYEFDSITQSFKKPSSNEGGENE